MISSIRQKFIHPKVSQLFNSVVLLSYKMFVFFFESSKLNSKIFVSLTRRCRLVNTGSPVEDAMKSWLFKAHDSIIEVTA